MKAALLSALLFGRGKGFNRNTNLSRAVDSLEKREAEKRIATLMTQVDVDVTLLSYGKVAEPEVAVFPLVHMLWIIHQDFGC